MNLGNRRAVVLMGVVLIICCFACVATKEGLENDKCQWIVPMSEYDPNKVYNCDECSSGKVLTKRKRKVGKGDLEFMEFTCGERA